MSNEELVKVNCHHSGQFKEANGVSDYIDEGFEVFEVDSNDIFIDVLLKLFGIGITLGRMWYKLPFEDLADKHPLWENVDANKKKMPSAGRWMRELDVYVEKPISYELIENRPR